MPAPKFDHPSPLTFGGYEHPRSYEDSRAVVLPVPFERTTSYVTGTRTAPREILLASGQVEMWDEEIARPTPSEAAGEGASLSEVRTGCRRLRI